MYTLDGRAEATSVVSSVKSIKIPKAKPTLPRCAECPVCGEPLEVRTPKRARNFEPKRRIVRGKHLGTAS